MSAEPVRLTAMRGGKPDLLPEVGPPEVTIPEELEMATLGAMTLLRSAAVYCSGCLSASDFYGDSHKAIFLAAQRLVKAGHPVELPQLRDELSRAKALQTAGGEDYLIQIAEYVPSPANYKSYASLLRRASAGIHQVRIGKALASGLIDWDRAELERRQFPPIEESSTTLPVRLAVKQYFDAVEELMSGGEAPRNISTGLSDLDRLLGPQSASAVILIGARPSMGKTALALTIARNIAMSGRKTLYFSLEMPMRLLTSRLILMESGVKGLDSFAIAKNLFDYQNALDGAERYYDLPLHIDDRSSVSAADVRAKAEELGAECVIVDYLQIMRGNDESNRNLTLASRMQDLRIMAKDLGIPIIVLSQLNRGTDQRTDKRPTMADIRDSGEIEEAASAIVLLYRKGYYERDGGSIDNQAAELIIAKNRYGPRGTALVGFLPHRALFADLTQENIHAYWRKDSE